MKKSAMAIEFLGICGSGKTYLNGKLKAMLQNENIEVYDRTDLYTQQKLNKATRLLSGIKLLFNPTYFLLYTDLLFTSFDKNRFNYLTKILLQQEYLTRQLKKTNSTVYLIDEGFTHLQWTFIGDCSSNNKNKVKKYLNKLYKKYKNAEFMLLCIDGNAELSYHRINNREQGWPKCFSEEDEISKLQKLNDYLNEYEIILSLLPKDVKKQHIPAAFDDNDIELCFRNIMEKVADTKERV